MTKNITAATVNLTRAAYAAGVEVRALRYAALDIPLLGQPEPMGGRWRRFSVTDCVRFAVVGKLQTFGISLATAVEVLAVAVDRHILSLTLCGIDLPPDFLVSRLDGLAVHLVPGPDGLDVFSAPLGTPPAAGPAVLILDIGLIAHETITRLATAGMSTAANAHGRSIGGRAGAAAGAPTSLNPNSAGTPAMES